MNIIVTNLWILKYIKTYSNNKVVTVVDYLFSCALFQSLQKITNKFKKNVQITSIFRELIV